LRRGDPSGIGAGYPVWRAPDFPTPREQSYPYLIENAILGSAAVVVLWSQHAASFAWVKRHILIAQRFFKPLVPIMLDETALPSTLLVESFAGSEPYSEIVPSLLSHLPAPNASDPLLTLGEQASHQYIRVRKEAIEQAATLQRGAHREETLAILDYLAHNDLINSVREQARDVLAAAAQPGTRASATPTRPKDARHQFRVRCKNGHITTFDRREVCSRHSNVARSVMRGLDELILTCPTCGVAMAVDVDCEGYG
jgi:hypothetical protein